MRDGPVERRRSQRTIEQTGSALEVKRVKLIENLDPTGVASGVVTVPDPENPGQWKDTTSKVPRIVNGIPIAASIAAGKIVIVMNYCGVWMAVNVECPD